MRSKKANVLSVVIMAFLLFSVGMLCANFLREPITDARTNLDCSNAAGISDGTKLVCLGTDLTMIYFIMLVLSLAGGAVLDKFVI
jgi:hypothetical protein